MTTASKSRRKVAEYRARQRAKGLRLVQHWVFDTRSPEFLERVRQDCISINNSPDEKEVMRLAEAAMQDIDGWVWEE